MTFELNQNVQVLDISGIWRNGVVLSKLNKNRKYKIHLKNFSSRSDAEYSTDLIRPAITEREFPKSSLKCKLSNLNSLVFNDKIIYQPNEDSEEEIEATVFENDPFNCFVKVLAGAQTRNVPYEYIILTSKNPNFKKYSTQLNIPTTTPSESLNDINKKSSKFVKKSTATSSAVQMNKSPSKSTSKQNKIYIDTAVDESNQDIILASPLPSPKRVRLENNTISMTNQNPTVLLMALPNLNPTQIASVITSTPRTSASSTLSSTSGISSASSITTASVNSSRNSTLIRQTIIDTNTNSDNHTINTPQTTGNTQMHPSNVVTPSISPPPPPVSLTEVSPTIPPAPPIQPLLQSIYSSKSTSSTNTEINSNQQPDQLNQTKTTNSATNNLNLPEQTQFASESNLQFNSKDYTDDLINKLSNRIDNLNAKVDLSELNKTLNASTEKITSSIDKLTSVLNDFLKKQLEIQADLQSKLNELQVESLKAKSSLDSQNTPMITITSDSNNLNTSLQQQSFCNINTNSIQLLNQKETELLNSVVNPNNMEYLTSEVVNEIQMKSSTAFQFANNLMERLFKPEEFVGCNVNGRGVNRMDQKKPLDRKRMKYIELLTNKLYNPESDIFLWPRCVKQMNRRILELCPQNKLKSQIATVIKEDRSI